MSDYARETQRIIVPVEIDQSARTDGDTIFTWKVAVPLEIVGMGFIPTEIFAVAVAAMSLKVEGTEKIVLDLAIGEAVGAEVYEDADEDVTDGPINVDVGESITLITKDVSNNTGKGFFVLYVKERVAHAA